MKILIYAGSCIKKNFSFIAPMRIVRACHRHGDEIKVVNWADNRINPKDLGNQIEDFPWGTCYTVNANKMITYAKKIVKNKLNMI